MFNQDTADAICARLAEGVSLRSVCAGDDMPSVGTFLLWVSKRPELAEQYALARALCLDAMAEDMLNIADTTEMGEKTVEKATGTETTTGDMVEHRRLRIETRKWLMAKMAPKKYGDKIELGGSLDVNSKIERITRRIVDGTGT